MDDKIVKLGIYGASGSMGSRVASLIKQDKYFDVVYEYSRRDNKNDINKLCSLSDVIIDFSNSNGSICLINYLLQNTFPLNMVICATGFSSQENEQIEKLSKKIPVLYAPNTSLGANLLVKSLQNIISGLRGSDCDIDIVEVHHKNKIDIPSGTALSIAKSILDNDNNYTMWDMLSNAPNKRQKNQITISSLRTGENPGEHQVIFSLSGETIKIKHNVHNKDVFALGAINLVKWFSDITSPGLYSIDDFFNSSL